MSVRHDAERRHLAHDEFLRHRDGLLSWFVSMAHAGFSAADLDAEILALTDALQVVRDLPRPNGSTRVGGGL